MEMRGRGRHGRSGWTPAACVAGWRAAGLSACLSLAALVPGPGVEAQEMPVPMETQVTILSSLWAEDRAHAERLEGGLTIAVAYQPRFRASLLAKEEFENLAFTRLRLPEGTALRIVAVDVTEVSALDRALSEDGVDIVYVAPLRAVDLAQLAAITRAHKTLTSTGVPDYVQAGLSIGLEVAEDKPKPLINREGAEAEGARFSSRVLRYARLVGEGP